MVDRRRQPRKCLALAVLVLTGFGCFGCTTAPDLENETSVELAVPADRTAQVLAFVLQARWPEADGENSAYSAPLERLAAGSFRIHYAIDVADRARVSQDCRVSPLDLDWRSPPEFSDRSDTEGRGRTLLDLRIETTGRSTCRVSFVDLSGDSAIGRELHESLSLLQLAGQLREHLADRDWESARDLVARLDDEDSDVDRTQTGRSPLAPLRDSMRSMVVAARIANEDRLGAHNDLADLLLRHPANDWLRDLEQRSTAIVTTDQDWRHSTLTRAIRNRSVVRRWSALCELDRPTIDSKTLGEVGDARSERIVLRRAIEEDRDGTVAAAVERSLNDRRSALLIRYPELLEAAGTDCALLLELCDDALHADDPAGAARLLARHWPSGGPTEHPQLYRRRDYLQSMLGDRRLVRIARSERCESWLPRPSFGVPESAFERNLARRVGDVDPTGVPAAPIDAERRPRPFAPLASPR
ncbi:MAG: hypothetical protein AAF196_11955 [Planctomycetota bacterium]